jgi:ABC-2 type transport system permease protein
MTDLMLIRAAFREALQTRRLLTALLLILLPAGFGLLWKSMTPTAEFDPGYVYDSLINSLVFTFTLTILAVIYGTGVVSQEMEQRTIVYLLTRPVPRWRILLAKFLVSLVVIVVVTLLATLLLAFAVFGSAKIGEAEFGPDLKALMMGALAYGSLFLLLGAALPRPLMIALLFVFGWESWVPIMPGSFARLSIMTYLRTLAKREVNESGSSITDGDINPLTAFGAPKIEIPLNEAWITLAAVSFLCLALALFVFSVKEYIPRGDPE